MELSEGWMGEVEKKKEMWESGIPVGSSGWDGCFRLGAREVIVQLGPECPGGAVCHTVRGWAAGIGLEDTVQPGGWCFMDGGEDAEG